MQTFDFIASVYIKAHYFWFWTTETHQSTNSLILQVFMNTFGGFPTARDSYMFSQNHSVSFVLHGQLLKNILFEGTHSVFIFHVF